MKLTRYEQETVINYNQAEGTACVFTHDPKLVRRLARLACTHPQAFILTDQEGKAVSYIVPKSCITIRAPYSEERRRAASDRAKAENLRPPNRRKSNINSEVENERE